MSTNHFLLTEAVDTPGLLLLFSQRLRPRAAAQLGASATVFTEVLKEVMREVTKNLLGGSQTVSSGLPVRQRIAVRSLRIRVHLRLSAVGQ